MIGRRQKPSTRSDREEQLLRRVIHSLARFQTIGTLRQTYDNKMVLWERVCSFPSGIADDESLRRHDCDCDEWKK